MNDIPYIIQTSVAMRKPLAKSLRSVFPQMSLIQIKLFFIALEHIDWHSKRPANFVIMDNQLVKYRLKRNDKTASSFAGVLRREYRKIIELSIVKKKDVTGHLFLDVYANDDFTVLAINPVFLYHFIHADRVVGQNMKRDYFQYAIEDIMNFQSKYSLLLYLELRIRQKYDASLNMPVNAVPTEVRFYTNALKDAFGLSFDSYTQTIDGVQHFNRASFERKVLCPALEEINKSRMIKILPPKKDECGIHEALFRKTKFNNKIKYYYIYFLTQEETFIDTEGQYFNREKLQEIQNRFYTLYQNNKKFLRFVDKISE